MKQRFGVPPFSPGLWDRLRAVFSRTGLWPLSVTEHTWSQAGCENGNESPDAEDAEINGGDWLRDEYAGRLEYPGSIPRGDPDWADLGLGAYDAGFDWRDIWAIRPDCAEFEHLALVPAADSWLVPREL